MKLSQLTNTNFQASLSKLAKGDIPIVTAYELKATISVVERENAKFEELRRALVEKHSEKNEDGSVKKNDKGEYRVAQDAIPEFMKEVNQLLDVDVEIAPLSLSALGTKLSLSAEDLFNLDGLITK